eukprot:7435748-Heterocapsa_arctica.AAC.1
MMYLNHSQRTSIGIVHNMLTEPSEVEGRGARPVREDSNGCAPQRHVHEGVGVATLHRGAGAHPHEEDGIK